MKPTYILKRCRQKQNSKSLLQGILVDAGAEAGRLVYDIEFVNIAKSNFIARMNFIQVMLVILQQDEFLLALKNRPHVCRLSFFIENGRFNIDYIVKYEDSFTIDEKRRIHLIISNSVRQAFKKASNKINSDVQNLKEPNYTGLNQGNSI